LYPRAFSSTPLCHQERPLLIRFLATQISRRFFIFWLDSRDGSRSSSCPSLVLVCRRHASSCGLRGWFPCFVMSADRPGLPQARERERGRERRVFFFPLPHAHDSRWLARKQAPPPRTMHSKKLAPDREKEWDGPATVVSPPPPSASPQQTVGTDARCKGPGGSRRVVCHSPPSCRVFGRSWLGDRFGDACF
jgi:hypothetical protein